MDGRGRIAVTALAVTGSQVRPVQLAPGRPPRPLTPHPFDATLAPGGYLGDHQALAAGQHAVHALWNDTRTGRLELFTTPLPAR